MRPLPLAPALSGLILALAAGCGGGSPPADSATGPAPAATPKAAPGVTGSVAAPQSGPMKAPIRD